MSYNLFTALSSFKTTALSRLIGPASVIGLMLALPAQAATPSSGSLTGYLSGSSPTSAAITYKSGPFVVTNATGEAYDNGAVSAPTCSPSTTFPCDNFDLTVTLPAGYSAMYPNTMVKVAMSFTTATGTNPGGVDEYDVYIYDQLDGKGNIIAKSLDSNPAIINLPVSDGTTVFTVQIVPTQAEGDSTTTTLTLMPAASGTPTGAGSNLSAAATPRYQIYDPSVLIYPGYPANPPAYSNANNSGEDSIGYDLKTGIIMNMNEVGQVFAIKPPELIADPENLVVKLPESCQAVWTNVSNNPGDETQATSLDPILWTDQASGRTFQSNSTAGAEATFTYTDDDGASWTPASAAPPNGGVDHETVASGPYPAGSPFAAVANAAGYNYATYYCSQAELPDFCQRSDSGGSTFGPGVPITNGVTSSCAGIHGHAKVSPYDGSVWIPIRNCGAVQGAAVSLDAGTTYSQVNVTGSTSGGAFFDPSVALASDGTAYYCYAGVDGHPHVSVSPGHNTTGGAASDGASWINDTDVGASLGIVTAVFVEAVAGDANRAACGFLGTTTPGDYGSEGFPGIFKLYVASTFDSGKTWTTVDVAPDNIVQAAGSICNQGTVCSSSPDYRNLLDFNEVTMDKYGRVLFAFDQGCVGPVCQGSPTIANNTLKADQRVLRQSGGMTLYSQYDGMTNNGPNPNSSSGVWPPKPACLAGARTSNDAVLTWQPGDNGGASVTSYKIFRSTTMGGENSGSPLATLAPTSGAPPLTYSDTTVGTLPNGPIYYTVEGINSAGTSVFSNEIVLGAAAAGQGSPCVAPGVTLSTGSTGTASTAGIPYDIITSVQVAEPFPGTGVTPTSSLQSTTLVFTIDLSSFEGLPTPPPNTSWTVEFNMPVSSPGTATDNTSQQIFISFDTFNNTRTDPTGELSLGFVDKTTTPNNDTTVCTYGLTSGGTCQVSGSYNSATNSITITLDTHAPISFTPNATGTTLSAFTVNFNPSPLPTLTSVTGVVQQLAGGAGTGLISVVDTTGSADYAIHGNYACQAGEVPIASLLINPGDGVAAAAGLQETLDASASTATNPDTVASYSFTPGDGSATVKQSSPTFSYSYPVGIFNPSVIVSDDRGANSQNAAMGILNVSPLPPTGVTASAGSSSSSVSLKWAATASRVSANSNITYNVYYSTSPGGEATPSTPNPSNAMTGITGTSATITGLTPGQTYYFTVYTLGGPGGTLSSKVSNEASFVASSSGSGSSGSSSSGGSSGGHTLTGNASGLGVSTLLGLGGMAAARRRRRLASKHRRAENGS